MNVVIAGFGVEGKASFEYWLSLGCDVTIADERDSLRVPVEASGALLGSEAFSGLDQFDMIIRAPGVAPSRLPYGDKVWSATNEFLEHCPAPVIGVTGTKGKGTVSSLAAAILRASGKTVHLVGNIGLPALSVLPQIKPEDVVVYELSSFQLWDVVASPHIAAVLMIEPDHLDVHADMDDYLRAKSQITAHQTGDDYVVYHPTNLLSAQVARHGLGRATRYAVEDDGEVYCKENTFFIHDTEICSVDNLQLVGAHNRENACAAISVALIAGADVAHVAEGLQSFHGLPHRLKFVRRVRGVAYYDDSIATTPGSAIAALRSFDKQQCIILGGSSKGVAYDDVIDECKRRGAIVIAVGQTGDRIVELCQDSGVVCHRVLGKMAEVVEVAQRVTPSHGIVILSPASASFDQYRNYTDRGDQFIAAVEALTE